MFAVVILGVGFIMIAALFPVAIRQSKSTGDETSSAAFARAAANYVSTVASDASVYYSTPAPTVMALPVQTTRTYPTSTNLYLSAWNNSAKTIALWRSLRGNMISTDDPRYAWVAFYCRAQDLNGNLRLPYAQLILICVHSTNKTIFDSTDIQQSTQARWTNLQGRPIRINIANGVANGTDLIGIQDDATVGTTVALPGAKNAAAEGAFVIVSNDTTNSGRATGRIYRLGIRRTDMDGQAVQSEQSSGTASTTTFGLVGMMDAWELMPGYDFKPETTQTDAASGRTIPALEPTTSGQTWQAYIVGRAFADNAYATPDPTFEGPAMDVSAYSTLIPCNP